MNQRFYSLDIFRGATVALMILVNNPGSWDYIYAPLDHASWHGCTPTDLVFPFFLFAVGNAMAFVIPRLEEKNIFWQKVIKRTLLIFGIGLFLNWFPFIKWNAEHTTYLAKPFKDVRIFGVLQRIALSYFFASVIVYYFKVRGSFVFGACLLLFYWLLCLIMNPSDPYSITGWFGSSVDMAIIGDSHMYHGEGVAFDPEGLMNTFAAIVQVIFGYLVGNYILTKGKTHEMVNGLFVAGCVMVACGFMWDIVFPINKKLWTSSYTVYTTGLALLVIALLIYLIEFKNVKGWWSRFFDVFGKNPLFIFMLSGLLPRLFALLDLYKYFGEKNTTVYVNPWNVWYHGALRHLPADPRIGSVLYAISVIIFMWFIAWLLDKKKIYIKV